jgi:hypothetical protein
MSFLAAAVKNRIADDAAYKASYPALTGRGGPATQELHVFLEELNPTAQRVGEYFEAVRLWNEQHPGLQDTMKACYLGLVFRDPEGLEKVVKVMQSARYFRTDNTDEAVAAIHADADFFVARGFSVIREKIEATAYAIQGIVQNVEEAAKYPSKYFEFHIKIGRLDREGNEPLTNGELEQLKTIANQFTEEFKTPIPLSYNCNPNQVGQDGQGNQRFLNVRFRNMGMSEITPQLKKLEDRIAAVGLRVLKTISEYVWYDSFTELDHGWIDYTPEEAVRLQENLAARGAA